MSPKRRSFCCSLSDIDWCLLLMMMRWLLCSFVLAGFSLVGCCNACDSTHPDFVPSLPGWNQPLPSNWFSGYLEYKLKGRTVHTHYVLVEAEDNLDNTKPLLYWTNGGPGASSLFGLLTELGPLQLSDDSLDDEYRRTGVPSLSYNPYTWTRLGHVLMFDQPAPVGFSFCVYDDDYDPDTCGGIAWTDELASESSYLALQAFYEKFPCFMSQDLYLTGESYAGIYVPTLARRIVQGEANNAIPLKGFAVGDGCLGTDTGICGSLSGESVDIWQVLFLAGHGQMPLDTFREVMRACNPHDEKLLFLQDADCDAVLKKMNEQVGGYYEYSLYDDCTYRNGLLKGAVNDYPCGGDIVMEQWLKVDEVQQALHVESSFFSVDNAAGFDYTPTEKDLTGFYQEVNGKLRVLIYNGDTDPAITSFAAQNWTSHLGFTEKEAWRPWTIDGCRRMGGYVTRYEGGFDFLTIRGSGHLVPAYKAPATFTFLKSWLVDGNDYPTFDKDCESPNGGQHQESNGKQHKNVNIEMNQ